jgi:hypothetical protein
MRSLRFRYINSYRLDGEDASIRASGLTVLDFSIVKRIRHWVGSETEYCHPQLPRRISQRAELKSRHSRKSGNP